MSSGSATKPRRSSRQSTPTSPPPSTRHGQRASMPVSASTPSLSSLAPPTSARKSLGRAASPAAQNRPALPLKAANSLLEQHKGKLHKVKTQTLHLGDKSADGTITIARVKCPVPKGVPGHIIKRFDTDAVSASSLFRAAFPTATETEEAVEMKWVAKGSKLKYGDTKKAGAEHDETRKLSGTWIPSGKAHLLAEEYKITKFAADLIAFPLVSNDAIETIEIGDSENDSPAAAPRSSKRARVASPGTAGTPTPKAAQSLSGVSTNGVSILQTLATDPETHITTETTEITVTVPEGSNEGMVASEEAVAEQIEQAKALVESLKEGGTLPSLTSSAKKRVLEEDEDDAPLPTSGTMADNRGFFGKIFRRAPARRGSAPITAGREIRAPGSQVAVLERKGVEGRRWVAGFGLAVAVGATAAAPYLFG